MQLSATPVSTGLRVRSSARNELALLARDGLKPSELGRVKTQMIKKLLAELNKAPERVMFPKGDAR